MMSPIDFSPSNSWNVLYAGFKVIVFHYVLISKDFYNLASWLKRTMMYLFIYTINTNTLVRSPSISKMGAVSFFQAARELKAVMSLDTQNLLSLTIFQYLVMQL